MHHANNGLTGGRGQWAATHEGAYLVDGNAILRPHLVKLIDAHYAVVRQDHGSALSSHATSALIHRLCTHVANIHLFKFLTILECRHGSWSPTSR